MQVGRIEADFVGDGEFVAAVDLRPTSEAWDELVYALAGAQGDQIVLVEEGGARADEAHIAFEYAPELRQFIEAGFADEGADGGEPSFRLVQQMRGYRWGVGAHAAEFWHFEDGVVFADAI